MIVKLRAIQVGGSRSLGLLLRWLPVMVAGACRSVRRTASRSDLREALAEGHAAETDGESGVVLEGGHLTGWPQGTETNLDGMVLLCWFHHHVVVTGKASTSTRIQKPGGSDSGGPGSGPNGSLLVRGWPSPHPRVLRPSATPTTPGNQKTIHQAPKPPTPMLERASPLAVPPMEHPKGPQRVPAAGLADGLDIEMDTSAMYAVEKPPTVGLSL